jgi:lysophospholipase L1-like esterase
MMRWNIASVVLFGMALAFVPGMALAGANADVSAQLQCGPFTKAAPPTPTPQTDPEAIARFRQINREVEAGPHAILFLGDSLTQKWDPTIWEQDSIFRDALNAGINGDRTENLLWRLRNGNLYRQHPNAVVLLIGTNDIGRNRSPEIVAEGIRGILELLRSRLPDTRILLLAVLPRSESPFSRRRDQVHAVNRLIRQCDDGEHVFYADVGTALLDSAGRLTRAISPDGVHLSPLGYARLTGRLDMELHKILEAGQPAVSRYLPAR